MHLTQITSPQGTVSYAYDSDGRRTTLTATGIGSWTTTFDPGGRVTSTKNPYNETTTLSYDAANRLIQKTKGNLNYEIYAYDVADQMTSVGYWWAGSILDRSLIYTYDPAGNVQSRNEGNRLINYGYDGADQQTAEVITGFAPMSIGYTYDHNANRLTQTQNGSPYQSFTYDAHDKLTSGTGGNETDGYDANGNETGISISGGQYAMTYDDEDRMTRLTSSGGLNNTFIYNGLGLRVGKTDSTGTYSYLCDGTTPGSSVLSDGAAVYTPGQSEHRAGASSYPDFDSLGNILTIDAASGNVTQTGYMLTGFGTPEYVSGSSPTPFKYGGANGCQTDNDTGLILMGHRYYDTRIGRFISQDPIGDGDNWYAYCDNSPTNGADPGGLYEVDVTVPANATYTWYWSSDDGLHSDPGSAVATVTNNTDQAITTTVDTDYSSTQVFNPIASAGSAGNSSLDQSAQAYSDFFMGGGLGTNMGAAGYGKFANGMTLPNDPSGLPEGWQHDPSHRAPDGSRHVGPNGERLDWQKGREGQPGFEGKDHWHKLRQKSNGRWETDPTVGRKGGHLLPGDVVKWGAAAVGAGAAGYGLYEGIKWGIAIFFAPETGGLSLAGAAATP